MGTLQKGRGIINCFSLLGLAEAANTCRAAKSAFTLLPHGPQQSLPLPSIPAFYNLRWVCQQQADRYQMDCLAMIETGFHPNSVSIMCKIQFGSTVTVMLLQHLSLGRSGCCIAIPISSHVIPAAGDVEGPCAPLPAPHKLRHCSNHLEYCAFSNLDCGRNWEQPMEK